MTRQKVARLFGRAMLLRCPRCGGGDMLRGWLSLVPRCPTCGLATERGEVDYWLGAYAINLVVAESLAVIIALIVLRATWPASGVATIVGVSLALALPLLFFPFSRTLWLAWDLGFRPAEPGDDA